MNGHEDIDYEFKKLYGRYPSAAERQQYKKHRPNSHFFAAQDLEALRENTPLAESVWNERRRRKKAAGNNH